MDKNKKVIISLGILTILFTIFGSTFAYFNWQTSEEQRTEVVFTLTQDFWCSVDGGGDVTETDAFIVPTTCTNSKHAIKREVTVTPTIHRNNLSINMDLWIDVDSIDSGLSNSENFKYALTTNSNSCTEGVISSGTFEGTSAGSQLRILNKNFSISTPQKYYLYVWLDAAETSTSTMDQSFSLSMSGVCVDEADPNEPVIDEGMIPVTLSSNGTVTTIQPGDPNWHDYENKEWANVVLVDNESRSTYQDTSGVTVNQEDILAYYVWIPRYKYRIPKTKCSTIANVNADEYPGCYSFVVSDTDKNNLSVWWYNYAVSEGGFTDFTQEQATTEVESGLQTGILNSSLGLSVSMTEFIAVYNEATGSSISYTTEFAPNNTISSVTEIDIEFEADTATMDMGDAANTYRTHPAFWWDNNSNGSVDSGETVAGIWVGKFETTGNATTPTILPNTSSLRSQNVSTQFTTSQKFSASSNIYGLSNTSTNSHMMKNSEWGAVAYLSHSKYGINDEIRINNNYNYTTGCGASTVNGSSTSACEISYNSSSTPQSTTGNITGVFDMSGGAYEYVMGVLADSNGNPRSGYDSSYNSGYNGLLYDDTSYTSGISFPAAKYYDLYTGTGPLDSCNGGICYGHALSETANWYEDYANFVDSDYPWFSRGGYYNVGADAGAFHSSSYIGSANNYYSWRSVLVVGFGA